MGQTEGQYAATTLDCNEFAPFRLHGEPLFINLPGSLRNITLGGSLAMDARRENTSDKDV